MTLPELLEAYRRRAIEAAAVGASAPLASVYDAVVADLAPLVDGNGARLPSSATPALERWLTAAQVAERLGCSVRYVYARAGTFPFTVRLGARVVRFSATGLAAWLERQR
jgi:excisionase family DNA binding protein